MLTEQNTKQPLTSLLLNRLQHTLLFHFCQRQSTTGNDNKTSKYRSQLGNVRKQLGLKSCFTNRENLLSATSTWQQAANKQTPLYSSRPCGKRYFVYDRSVQVPELSEE